VRIFTFLAVVLLVSLGAFVVYQTKVHNPEVARELRSQPDGARAGRVMLMTIDDRKTIPVNYLREGNEVFIGADGPWWRDMRDNGQPVTLLIRGEKFAGRARAVSGQPGFTKDVFKRLRPDTPKWLPDWLNGVLVVIELADVEAIESDPSEVPEAADEAGEPTKIFIEETS